MLLKGLLVFLQISKELDGFLRFPSLHLKSICCIKIYQKFLLLNAPQELQKIKSTLPEYECI